jgi:hypothetical protein
VLFGAPTRSDSPRAVHPVKLVCVARGIHDSLHENAVRAGTLHQLLPQKGSLLPIDKC